MMFFSSKILIIGLILLNVCQQSFAQENRQVKFVFEGNKIFSSTELLDVLEKCRQDYRKNGATDDDRIIADCLRKPVKIYMFARGYFAAKIGELKTKQAGKDWEITIPVIEGEQYRLGEISVEGEKFFTEKDILGTFPMKKGDIVNATLIYDWLSSLENFYANKGFLQFSCEPEPDFVNDIVNIKFIVDEGRSFKVGRIEFIIDTNLSDNSLKRYLTFKEGETFSRQKLKESVEYLNKLNEFQEIDADKDVSLQLGDGVAITNLKITITKKKEQ